MEAPSSRRTLADISVQVVGRALNLIAGVVVTVVITRALGEEDFGRWATVFAILQIATYLGDFGLEQVAVRRAAADPGHEREWVGGLLSLRLAVALPLTLLCAGAQLWIADTSEMRAAGLLLCGTQLLAALSATRATFQLRTRNDLTILVLSVNSALWTVGVLALASGDGGMVGYALAFVAAAAVSTLLGVTLAVRLARPRLRGSRGMWPELLRVGAPLALASVMMTAYLRIDQVLLFELVGSRDAGLYGAIYRILDSAQFLPGAVMTTLFPVLAAAWPSDMEKARRLAASTAEYLAMLSLPVLGFTIVASEPIVLLLFGPGFIDAAPALPVLMGALVAISLAFLAGHLVLVLDLQRRFVRYAAAGLVFNVVLNLLLIPSYGFMAAAWITLGTEALVAGLTLRMVLHGLGMKPPVARFARIVGASALGTAVVAISAAAGAPLGLLAVVAAVAYPSVFVVLGALDPRAIRDLLSHRGAE